MALINWSIATLALLAALVCCSAAPTAKISTERCMAEDLVQDGLVNDKTSGENSTKIDPILLLLEEISRLKLDLMPYNGKPAAKVENSPTEKKEISNHLAESPATQPRPSSQEKEHSNQPAFQKSMGVATSGYRLLCCQRPSSLGSSNERKQKDLSPSTDKEVEPSPVPASKQSDDSSRLTTLLNRLSKA